MFYLGLELGLIFGVLLSLNIGIRMGHKVSKDLVNDYKESADYWHKEMVWWTNRCEEWRKACLEAWTKELKKEIDEL